MVSYLRSTKAGKGGIMYRLADNIWGPYTDPIALFPYSACNILPKAADGSNVSAIYGGIINDRWVENNGQIMYVLISQYQAKEPWLYTSSIVKISFATQSYKLTFNLNGAEGENIEKNLVLGREVVVPQVNITKEGMVFKEWNTKEDGTGVSYQPGETLVYNTRDLSTNDVELYAIWTTQSALDPSENTSERQPKTHALYIMAGVMGGIIILAVIGTTLGVSKYKKSKYKGDNYGI